MRKRALERLREGFLAELVEIRRRLRVPERDSLPRDGDDAAQATVDLELSAGEQDRLRRRVGDIAEALNRLREGRYGQCEDCAAEIPDARLRALPAAATCLDCQVRRERHQADGNS